MAASVFLLEGRLPIDFLLPLLHGGTRKVQGRGGVGLGNIFLAVFITHQKGAPHKPSAVIVFKGPTKSMWSDSWWGWAGLPIILLLPCGSCKKVSWYGCIENIRIRH